MGAEVIATPFGKFLIPPGDLIGSTLKAGTCWDGPGFLQPIAREHGRLGEPGCTILDVGANIGAFTVWCAYHDAWRVVAVEPVPETLRYLKANLDLNQGICGSSVIPVGQAGYSHRATLWVPALDPGNLGGTALEVLKPNQVASPADRCVEAIPLDTLQPLFGQRVSLIKVDAQGCDGAVLLGLEQTIARDHPAIVFEWEADLAGPHGVTLEALLYTLRETWHYSVLPWPEQPNNYLAVWRGAECPV